MIGFALTWEGQRDGALWVSGDTVLYGGVRAVADRVPVDVALLHLGGRAEVEAAFRRAPADVRDPLRWLEPGVAAQVS